MDRLKPDHTLDHILGMLAAYGCVLEALVKTHPDPLNLMRLYLTCVEKTARNLGPLQQQGEQCESKLLAKHCAHWDVPTTSMLEPGDNRDRPGTDGIWTGS